MCSVCSIYNKAPLDDGRNKSSDHCTCSSPKAEGVASQTHAVDQRAIRCHTPVSTFIRAIGAMDVEL